MGCGCKKNTTGKKNSSSSKSKKGMQDLIRKKIIEQIQKGNSNPKPSQ